MRMLPRSIRRWAMGLLFSPLVLLPTSQGYAQEPETCVIQPHGTAPAAPFKVPSLTLESGKTLYFFPAGDLYPPAIADPNRVRIAAEVQAYNHTEIPGAGDLRFALKAGSPLSLVRMIPPSPKGLKWQLSIEGGVDAQFDIRNELDAIGWEGNLGLSLAFQGASPTTTKVAYRHTSSHLGDEYIEDTGRERIGYRRDEVILGVRIRLAPLTWSYLEGGYPFSQGNEDLQEPWRVQGGVEYENPCRFIDGRVGWYLAANIESYEERDWRVDATVEMGLSMRSAGKTWRLGLTHHDGRVPQGEFFQFTESYTALGVWVDL